MIARMWTARIDAARAAEYETFARDVSLPMFRRQLGFRGAIMLRRGANCVVITMWQDAGSVAALDASETYAETVERIIRQGFLKGRQSVEIFDTHLMFTADTTE